MFKQLLMFFLVMMLAVATVGCSEESTEPTPTTGTISGKITFDGTWPTTGNVQVSVYTTVAPPAYVPAGPPEQSSDPIAEGTEYNFSFEGLDFSSYAAVFVSWRDPANPAGALLLGMYQADASNSGMNAFGLPVAEPTAITLSADNADVSNIDIKADFNLLP